MKRSAQPLPPRAHEGGRAFDAEKAQLALERVGHVLRAVIVAQAQATCDVLGGAAGMLPHALAGHDR